MSEEKKLNPSFKRAADSKVTVEQDLGPATIQPTNEGPKPFLRASDQPVKTQDDLTDAEINELLEQEKKIKEEIEKMVSKKEETMIPETVIADKYPELETSTPDVESFNDVYDKVTGKTVVNTVSEEPVVEEKKSFKISIKKDPKVQEALDMLSKTKEVSEEKLTEERGTESMFYPEESKLTEREVDISELINEVYEKEEKEEVKAKEPVKKAKVVDISGLTIVNKTEMDKERDLRQALFNNKAAFQIVAAQSGYMAKVSPLVHKDIVNMLYGNLGRYEYKKAVYKTIHDKVFDTSVGKFDFDQFLKYTSVEDMETFYYGVYASTFPNEGSFRYTCSECGEEHDYKVNHNNLIKTTDKDHMRKLIDDVTRNSTSIEKMKEYSLVGTGEAIQLSESGLIIELKTPSLFDSLEILRTVPEKTIDKDAVSVTNMLYINKVLIPSKESAGAFTEENNKTSILRIIDNLPIDDASELQTAVFDRVDKNRITYSIKNIKCLDCSHEEKDIPISIEDILFTLIFEKTQ
jgi:hypothetical protein